MNLESSQNNKKKTHTLLTQTSDVCSTLQYIYSSTQWENLHSISSTSFKKIFNVQYQETSLIYIPSELDIYYVAITSTANIH